MSLVTDYVMRTCESRMADVLGSVKRELKPERQYIRLCREYPTYAQDKEIYRRFKESGMIYEGRLSLAEQEAIDRARRAETKYARIPTDPPTVFDNQCAIFGSYIEMLSLPSFDLSPVQYSNAIRHLTMALKRIFGRTTVLRQWVALQRRFPFIRLYFDRYLFAVGRRSGKTSSTAFAMTVLGMLLYDVDKYNDELPRTKSIDNIFGVLFYAATKANTSDFITAKGGLRDSVRKIVSEFEEKEDIPVHITDTGDNATIGNVEVTTSVIGASDRVRLVVCSSHRRYGCRSGRRWYRNRGTSSVCWFTVVLRQMYVPIGGRSVHTVHD